MLHAVIMAGGSGTRFWPLSRRNSPKQFLSLWDDRSLIQQAFDRCRPLIPPDRIHVVTGQSLASLTREHLPELPQTGLLVEPCPRNTAPCLALAALHLLAVDPEAVMLVLSADQVISTIEQFQQGVRWAVDLITRNPHRLVLFGAVPTYPATGFGYIERGQSIFPAAFEVLAFHEKPDRENAERFLRSGNCLWNCGIFTWRADRILSAILTHEPEMSAPLARIRDAIGQPQYVATLNEEFLKLKAISIDYAVLERDADIAVVEAPFVWDDVGGWEAVARLHGSDPQHNSVLARAVLLDTENSIVVGDPDVLIAVKGLRDCVVVQSGKSLLIMSRHDEQGLRQLVARIEEQGHGEFL